MDWGFMEKAIASERTTCPRGIVKLDFPLTVIAAWGEEDWRPLTPAAPPVGRAIEPAEMGRSEPPKVFERAMRSFEAPMDMWRVWRRVAFLSTALFEDYE
jgi:hypothetical protein